MTDTNKPKKPVPVRRKVAPAPPRVAASGPARDDARVAKVIARAGLCSRRDAEDWIAAGRVSVNGTVIDSPALNVRPGDKLAVDGVPVGEREKTRLFLFHKPRGLVTTARDPEGRPTIFESLPSELPRLVSIGRLDINTEGLMLLTNDGGLSRLLELPATGWLRRYRVRAKGEITQAVLDGLVKGISIEGVDYAGIEATLDRIQGANLWLTMGLREGKNREIKRVLEHLGLTVNRLIRVSFGPFQLGELTEGAVEEVRTKVLAEQLGPALAAEARVDFEERLEPRRPAQGDRAAPRAGRGPSGDRPVRRAEPLDASRPGRTAGDDRPRSGEGHASYGNRPLRRAEPFETPRPGRSATSPRAHVSALRAAREEAAGREGRRRIDRGATTDRKGRAVTVERVERVGSRQAAAIADGRNARRFARETEERAPARSAGAAPRSRVGRPSHAGQAGERDGRAASSRFGRAPLRDGGRDERRAKPFVREAAGGETAARGSNDGAGARSKFDTSKRFAGAHAPRGFEETGGRTGTKSRFGGKPGGFGGRQRLDRGDERRAETGHQGRPDFGAKERGARKFVPRTGSAPGAGLAPKGRSGGKPGGTAPGRPQPSGGRGDGGRRPPRG